MQFRQKLHPAHDPRKGRELLVEDSRPVKEIGHATIVRQLSLPAKRLDPKHYRWLCEVVEGGTRLVHRPGASTVHRGPDGLSRSPPSHTALLLCRERDWTAFRAQMHGLEELERTADVEDPVVPAPEDEEPYDEDLLDHWRRSPDPGR